MNRVWTPKEQSDYSEILQLVSVCHIHLNQAAHWLEHNDLGRAEFRARELAENARLLANALYRAQRVSGEVKG